MLKKFEAVLFDLDGTLIDTAPDLAMALNDLLRHEHRKQLTLSQVRNVISEGIPGLLKLGLNISPADQQYTNFKQHILDYYREHIFIYSRIFYSIPVVLQHINHHKIPWGIVTNKSAQLTNLLVKPLGLFKNAGCIVAGDTLARCKPDPEPLQYATALLNVKPEKCCYVGDAYTDVIAAKATGMFSVTALYGYISDQTNPLLWGADAYIKKPEDLCKIIT